MADVWERLDNDFGLPDEIALRCVKELIKLNIPASNEDQTFVSLYDKFQEVTHDLIEVNQEG